ncbi:MAG: hypothetical protein WBF87_10120 [Mesorhizobium sp.]
MAKATAIRAKPRREAQSGQYIGRTKEGLLIPKPDFRPASFTVRELQKAIREVRREAAADAG